MFGNGHSMPCTTKKGQSNMNMSEFYEMIESGKRDDIDKLVTIPAKDAKPGDVIICGGRYALVIEVKTYSPNHYIRKTIKPPIKDNYDAVAVFTTNGVRWYGIPR